MSERKRERERNTRRKTRMKVEERGDTYAFEICCTKVIFFIQFYIRPKTLFFVEHRSFCYSIYIYVYVVFAKFTYKIRSLKYSPSIKLDICQTTV